MLILFAFENYYIYKNTIFQELTFDNDKFAGFFFFVSLGDQTKFNIACNISTTSSNTGKESGGNENTSPSKLK
jgi:hypothetical protein